MDFAPAGIETVSDDDLLTLFTRAHELLADFARLATKFGGLPAGAELGVQHAIAMSLAFGLEVSRRADVELERLSHADL
jgi:hypothetical protein